ncbi:hypothetical protein SEVIR_1G333325v4 [Setaria viridis]
MPSSAAAILGMTYGDGDAEHGPPEAGSRGRGRPRPGKHLVVDEPVTLHGIALPLPACPCRCQTLAKCPSPGTDRPSAELAATGFVGMLQRPGGSWGVSGGVFACVLDRVHVRGGARWSPRVALPTRRRSTSTATSTGRARTRRPSAKRRPAEQRPS